VNLEAIHYGLASPEQARSIFDWLDGKREIAADTSRGADIYHWRFAPRATTRRNIDTYVWAWSNPEQIPWGGQIQDGGAVLGFSFHDMMARLQNQRPRRRVEAPARDPRVVPRSAKRRRLPRLLRQTRTRHPARRRPRRRPRHGPGVPRKRARSAGDASRLPRLPSQAPRATSCIPACRKTGLRSPSAAFVFKIAC
jgi:hypothetical protein